MKDYHTTPVALAADHGGYALKEAIRAHLEAKGIPYKDFGTHSADSCDYPGTFPASFLPVLLAYRCCFLW